jgi:hypothetical protein
LVKRVAVVEIFSLARRLWEAHCVMPGTIDEVVTRALDLPDHRVHVGRVVPFQTVRSLRCVIDGWYLRLIGDVDEDERWWRIQEVHASPSEVE